METLMNAMANLIRKDGASAITIYGFTDSRGGFSPNLELGRERASAAKQYLKKELLALGVRHAVTIKVISKGLTGAVASNTSALGQSLNRHVTVVATLKKYVTGNAKTVISLNNK
jgi:outer membrane protein OmpA-like peptidoglycan-associated protein